MHCGRDFLVCNNNEDDTSNQYPSLSNAFKIMKARHPNKDLIWKQLTGFEKQYEVASIEAREIKLPTNIGYAAIHSKGLSCLQEKVFMIAETRLFIVNNEIISGAGCIENFTPLNRHNQDVIGAIHCIFERKRNNKETFKDENLAKRMENFARFTIIPALTTANPNFPKSYTLDLYLDEKNDKIGIVELNPIVRSGLYANDSDAVFLKLIENLVSKNK